MLFVIHLVGHLSKDVYSVYEVVYQTYCYVIKYTSGTLSLEQGQMIKGDKNILYTKMEVL